MHLLVTSERIFLGSADGSIWTNSVDAADFWERYLSVFDSVTVISRLRRVPIDGPGSQPVAKGAIRVLPIVAGRGPLGRLRSAASAHRVFRAALTEEAAVILRTPGFVPLAFERKLRRDGRPFGVEVTGDPAELLGSPGLPGLAARLARPVMVRALRRQCRGAAAAAYVTRSALQARYPPGPRAFATWYSSVNLPTDSFASGPRFSFQDAEGFTLITVASMERNHKGIDVLIRAAQAARSTGLRIRLVLVGGGLNMSYLKATAARLGVPAEFTGELPGSQAVRARLRDAHVFVLPSYSEGLSRALLEAMAQALPCIATSVGGTSEVLPSEVLVPPGDVGQLARRISELCRDPARLREMSRANLETARAYRNDALEPRRRQFYERLTEETRRHFSDRASSRQARLSHFVFSDGILGVGTDIRRFRWPFGESAPPAAPQEYARCRVGIEVLRASSRYMRDRLAFATRSNACGRYNHFFAFPRGDELIYSRKLAPGVRLFLRCHGVRSGRPAIQVNPGYLRLVGYRFMNLHSVSYVAADLAAVLLLRAGLAPLHCSAVYLRGRTLTIFAPANTGKTLSALTLCKHLGAELLSEDLSITDGRRIYAVPWTNTSRYYPQLRGRRLPAFAAALRAALPLLDLLPGRRVSAARLFRLPLGPTGLAVSHVIVLESGAPCTAPLAASETASKLLNLSRAEFNYARGPLNNAYEYFHPDLDIEACTDTERRILYELCANATSCIVVRSRRPDSFARMIATALDIPCP